LHPHRGRHGSMPAMETEPRTTSLSVIAISWLTAALAFPSALIGAVCGQGIGALFGGCDWIGISIPVDRQVWALVNQPTLNFSSQPAAFGYWLGSALVPLAVAAAAVGFLPRARSLVTELAVVQMAWAMSIAAVAIMPMLDTNDGHLGRFLSLHGWPEYWIWAGPILAATVSLLPALRLLELARRRQPEIRRATRMMVVVIHLVLPAVAWLILISVVRSAVPVFAAAAAILPLTATIVFAWIRYPAPYVWPLELPKPMEIMVVVSAAVILGGTLWLAGRPLEKGGRAGVIWGHPQAFNNIRPWIQPWRLNGNAILSGGVDGGSSHPEPSQ
jgi:hypothetical protein